MSREKNLKRLRKSLQETQGVLEDLVEDTSKELEHRLKDTRSEANKKFADTSKRLQKNYALLRSQLDAAVKDASAEIQSRYKQTKKDAEKQYGETSEKVAAGYSETKSDLQKRVSEAKVRAKATGEDLRGRTAELLQAIATGVLTARNKLDPKHKMAVRDENEKFRMTKAGYFKRFVAIAVIIVAKKNKLMSLGQQLYSKLQDENTRKVFKEEAMEQWNTMRRLVRAYANGHYREFPYGSLVKIVAAIVYFVSVVDLVPDFIPILGLTDDLAILAWVYSSVKDDLQQFVDWEAANERRKEKEKEAETQRKQTATASTASPVADRQASPSPTTNKTTTGNTSTGSTTSTTSATSGTTGGLGGGSKNDGTQRTGSSSGTGSTGSSTGTSGGSSSSSNRGNQS